mmetsp:Transcript_16751/g.43480  ORF Transcript_16751/g.43480 Transcript_16751/m.43480 type:complete len:207 (-) Transcript_16751:129-749(-)
MPGGNCTPSVTGSNVSPSVAAVPVNTKLILGSSLRELTASSSVEETAAVLSPLDGVALGVTDSGDPAVAFCESFSRNVSTMLAASHVFIGDINTLIIRTGSAPLSAVASFRAPTSAATDSSGAGAGCAAASSHTSRGGCAPSPAAAAATSDVEASAGAAVGVGGGIATSSLSACSPTDIVAGCLAALSFPPHPFSQSQFTFPCQPE